MLKIGLTGGIGSGKSTVSRLFAELGVPVLDADEIAHALTGPQGTLMPQLIATFGAEIEMPEGGLNRVLMRQMVFADATLRQRLEAIMHPAIKESMFTSAAKSLAPYVIMAIPLLIETGQDREVDRVLVVDVPESLQIERVVTRSNLTETEVQTIIATQMPRTERLKHADDVLVNTSSLTTLMPKVKALHEAYLHYAKEGKS